MIVHFVTCVLLIVCGLAPSVRAQVGQHPAILSVDGTLPLSLVGQARRVHLLGALELYTLALYSGGPSFERERLLSAEAPKALRIHVTHEDDLRRRVTIDWRNELVPRLEAAATAHLRGAFAPLRHGDVVLVEYVPAKGTTVKVNGQVAVFNANHDLMLAFLDHWLGQRPISEEIKRALLGVA